MWKYLLYLVSFTPFKPPKLSINPISPQSDDFFPHPIVLSNPHSKPTRSANLIPISESHFLFLPFHSSFHTHHPLLPFPTFFSISSDPTKSNPISPFLPSPSSFHPSLHTPPQSLRIQSIHHSQSDFTPSTPTPPTTQPLLPTPQTPSTPPLPKFPPIHPQNSPEIRIPPKSPSKPLSIPTMHSPPSPPHP